jgi:hypothetical protein
MNGYVIDIKGIHVQQRNIYLEHSPESANLLYIRDEYGNEVKITIINNEITSTEHLIKK